MGEFDSWSDEGTRVKFLGNGVPAITENESVEYRGFIDFFDTFVNGGAALGGFILVDPLLIITVEFIHLHSDGLKTFQAQSHTIVYAANEFSFEGFGLVGI